jgi:hypothetical protein
LRGEPLGRAIAQRQLQARASDGTSRDVTVSIGKPKSDPRFGGHWSCVHQISGLGDDITRTVIGIDGVQALMLTFQMVAITLRHVQATQHVRISWLDQDEPAF